MCRVRTKWTDLVLRIRDTAPVGIIVTDKLARRIPGPRVRARKYNKAVDQTSLRSADHRRLAVF